jgi:hypothetical protein
VPETAKIATDHGPLDVESRPSGVSGLVITRAAFHNEDTGEWKIRRQWLITHESSGHAVTRTPFERLSDALACAARMGRFADWTRTREEILNDPEMRELVQNAIKSTEHDRLGEEIAKLRKTL